MLTARKASPIIARVLLGLLFVVFGLNGFLHFIPLPPLPDKAGNLLGAFAAAGYMFPLIKGTEVLAGLALLSGRFVPLALTVLAPVVVNIAAFHLFLTPGDVGLALLLVALEAYLAYAYRGSFRAVLAAGAKPAPVAEEAPRGHALAAGVR